MGSLFRGGMMTHPTLAELLNSNGGNVNDHLCYCPPCWRRREDARQLQSFSPPPPESKAPAVAALGAPGLGAWPTTEAKV
mgnify:CR=1 FL=1